MTKREPEPSALLAELAGGGSVSKAEALRVADRMRSAVGAEDSSQWDFDEIYELVLVAGKARVLEATPTLERLLDAQEPMTLCLVLDILCVAWGRSEDYIERIMTFAVGAVWDEELDVQEKALEILGSYVRSRLREEQGKPSETVRRVAELLWQQFSSEDEQWIIRRAAYRAMVIASGREVNGKDQGKAIFAALPSVQNLDSLVPELDREAIREVRALVP